MERRTTPSAHVQMPDSSKAEKLVVFVTLGKTRQSDPQCLGRGSFLLLHTKPNKPQDINESYRCYALHLMSCVARQGSASF